LTKRIQRGRTIMCGIVGIVQLAGSKRVTEQEILRMRQMMRHRGPDGEGSYINERASLGLGAVRLAIVDPENGHQPIRSPEGGAVIVMNGEIYGYKELRRTLELDGAKFRTHSDTEVVLNLYLKRGLELTSELDGEFAFAIADERHDQVIIARDRFGLKPLYYTVHEGRLYFGSEIKTLLADPSIPRKVNLTTVVQQMMRADSLARTFLEGIQVVPPGHMLVVREGKLEVRRYWEPELPRATDFDTSLSVMEHTRELKRLITESVKKRMIADVEVGCYLSGGLDSSIVAHLMQQHSGKPIKTFSIRFTNERFDESRFAREMAAHIGSEHHEVTVSEVDLARNLPQALFHCEHLVQSTDGVGKYLLSREVRKHVKAVMTGEGHDELCFGYPWHKTTKLLTDWDRRRAAILRGMVSNRETAPKGLDLTESEHSDMAELVARHGFYPVSAGNIREMERFAPELFSPDLIAQVRGMDARDIYREDLDPRSLLGRTLMSQNQYEFIKKTLPYYCLRYLGSEIEMANSIEGRLPFFDLAFVSHAFKVPPRYHVLGLREKNLLRTAFAEELPSSIIKRTKHGYSAEILDGFLGAGAPEYFNHFLSESSLARTGIFNPKQTQTVLNTIRENRVTGQERVLYQKSIMLILAFQLMHEMFIERLPSDGKAAVYA
jgi:asparagine synthase (glutamine-hydrolysing)